MNGARFKCEMKYFLWNMVKDEKMKDENDEWC